MKFGIVFANVLGFGDPDGAVELAQSAEAAGFESLWTVEHVVVPVGYKSSYPYAAGGRMPGPEDLPIPDPLIWLTYVAAVTSTIRLGTGILILPERNPVVVAKEIATLDHLSGGRVELGVGAGWLQEEFDAIGVPFDDRGKRLDEHIGALRALWTDEPASYDGELVKFKPVHSKPHPNQRPVPIVIGGHTAAAARRAGRLGDGFFPAKGDYPQLLSVVRAAAEEAGRDPDAIEITLGAEDLFGPDAMDGVKRLEDLGAHRVTVPSLSFAFSGEPLADSLKRYGDEVIAKY
jgi:probable F420-dependent oxidoreductase